ncbi:glutaredoxin domain-containing protein [Alkalibacillus silvisoli]|uniref:Glutaredoxin family protein n=1 Tax=Alkalibacillus silvisoli TaxID=392823 RepID=A0ABP3JVQ9_9BACI
MARSIIVYTQSACGHCQRQIDWMVENQIPFEQREISNEIFRTEFLNMNGEGTPLTVIKNNNASEVITGFNKETLTNKFLK